jgi:hypothetical protein
MKVSKKLKATDYSNISGFILENTIAQVINKD